MTLEEIKNKFQSLGLLQEEAVFEAYDEGIFTYHLNKDDGTFYAIDIVNHDKAFFNKEKVCNLINDIGVYYLGFGHYKTDERGLESLIGETMELKLSDFLKKD